MLVENRRRRIAKTRQAEAKFQRIVSKYGVPPASTRDLQSAMVQGTALYAAELTWNGRKGIKGEYRAAINRMGGAERGPFAQRHWGSSLPRAVSRRPGPSSTSTRPASHDASTTYPGTAMVPCRSLPGTAPP